MQSVLSPNTQKPPRFLVSSLRLMKSLDKIKMPSYYLKDEKERKKQLETMTQEIKRNNVLRIRKQSVLPEKMKTYIPSRVTSAYTSRSRSPNLALLEDQSNKAIRQSFLQYRENKQIEEQKLQIIQSLIKKLNDHSYKPKKQEYHTSSPKVEFITEYRPIRSRSKEMDIRDLETLDKLNQDKINIKRIVSYKQEMQFRQQSK